MDETIKLLREQTILCSRLLKLFDDLADALRKNSLDMLETTQKINLIVQELLKNSAQSRKFLDVSKSKTFGDFIENQNDGIQRDVAKNLLRQIGNFQTKIADKSELLSRLAQVGMEFVEFNINVLSQTSTSVTYGSAAETGSQRDRRMFDANV